METVSYGTRMYDTHQSAGHSLLYKERMAEAFIWTIVYLSIYYKYQII